MIDYKVPVVVYQPEGLFEGCRYQVFTATYCTVSHKPIDISKNYACFESEEEVKAYIKGFETGQEEAE